VNVNDGVARGQRRAARRVGTAARALALLAWVACAVAGCAVAGCGAPDAQRAPGRQAPPTVVRPEPADLLFLRGFVRTLDPRQPEAEALAVRGGRIAIVGSSAEAAAWAGPGTRVIDLHGRPLYPGFADSHLHLSGYARTLLDVDLTGTASEAECVARVAAAAAGRPDGRWILGRGWDQNDWEDTAFPTHAALSAALPRHPAALRRVDGHAVLANAAALAAAGIDATTRDPEGGRILRDAAGAPTGVLVDNAMVLLDRVIPDVPPAELASAVRRAVAELHAHGITSVHDAGVPWSDVEVYAALAREGRFLLRAHVMLDGTRPDAWVEGRGLPTADLTGQGLIAVRALKLYADGALGSRGAALLADYSDDPGNRGLLLTPPQDLEALCVRALGAGWQVATHAIGDRGNRVALDAYAAAFAAVPPERRGRLADGAPVPEPRFRIEHVQVLAPEDVPRFAELGVIASMQCQHQTSDMPWAEARLGPVRVRGAYAWRSLFDAGARLAGGSDCPVERPDPIAAFHAAVTRSNEAGEPFGGWYPEQCLTRPEALAMLTAWPAYAAFDEGRLGQLRPGLLADLVVLSDDLLTVPEGALMELEVDLTVVDGEVVHER
jgi:predicted amidohydrolase YtcJ